MTRLKHLTIIGVIAVFSQFSLGVNGQVSVDAEYRPRFEYRDGYKELNPDRKIVTILPVVSLKRPFS